MQCSKRNLFVTRSSKSKVQKATFGNKLSLWPWKLLNCIQSHRWILRAELASWDNIKPMYSKAQVQFSCHSSQRGHHTNPSEWYCWTIWVYEVWVQCQNSKDQCLQSYFCKFHVGSSMWKMRVSTSQGWIFTHPKLDHGVIMLVCALVQEVSFSMVLCIRSCLWMKL